LKEIFVFVNRKLWLRVLAVSALAIFVSGCASTKMSRGTCTRIAAVLGGGAGAALGTAGDDGDGGASEVAVGAVAGVVAGAVLGHFVCKKIIAEAKPKPPPPPPRRAAPAPPPPPPPPAPEPEPDPCAGTIVLRGVQFDFDRAEIRADAAVILEEAASQLSQCEEGSITVKGHTDSTGPEGYNQGLSERRAQAVSSYLSGQGVGASRLQSVGLGESQPVATNATRDGRALNRRVELDLQK